MKNFLMVLTLSTGMMAPAYALAEGAPAPVRVDPTEEFTELVDGDVKIHDVVSDVTEVYEAVKAYRAEQDTKAKLALLLLLLAIAFKTIISAAKLIANEFLSSATGKNVIRVGTLFLGLAVLVLGRAAAGMHWIDAFFLSLSGPGAIVVHELMDIFSDDKNAGLPRR